MLHRSWALFALKWTMIRRSLERTHYSGYLILLVLFLLGALASLGIGFLLYYLGSLVEKDKAFPALLLLLDGVVILYCFFYAWGLLLELQRTDLIDFRKMLLLPISLPAVFLINFIVSLLGPLFLFSIPALTGLLWGLRPHMGNGIFPAGFLMALSFAVMLGAWSYYLRGRLAILMEHPRHRRVIFMLLPIGFIFLAQLPAIIMQVASKNAPGRTSGALLSFIEPHLISINQAVPFLWPAYGLWSVCTREALWVFPASIVAMWLVALLGLRMGYVTTLRHYMGTYASSRTAASVRPKRKMRPPITAKRIPFLAEDTSALVCGFYTSFSRHPHVRMLLLMPICFGLFVLFMHYSGAYGDTASSRAWIPTACLLWPFINFSFFMFNIFGIDTFSFQALQLLPAPRYKYLLAKNIAIAPIVLGLVSFFIAVSLFLADVPGGIILLSFLLAIQLFLLFCTIGNFISIKFPHRLHRDALRAPGRRLYMVINGFASTLLSTLLIIPALLCLLVYRYPPRFLTHQHGTWGLFLPAFLLTIITAILYWRTLPHAGDLLTAEEHLISAKLLGDRD